jgi:hypothetical protein
VSGSHAFYFNSAIRDKQSQQIALYQKPPDFYKAVSLPDERLAIAYFRSGEIDYFLGHYL